MLWKGEKARRERYKQKEGRMAEREISEKETKRERRMRKKRKKGRGAIVYLYPYSRVFYDIIIFLYILRVSC